MIDIIACSMLSSLCFGLIVFFIVKKLILSRMLIALSCSNDKILTLESKIKQLTSSLNVNVAPTLKQSIISDKIHLNDSNTQLEKQLSIKLQEAIDNNNIIEKAKLDILRCKEEQEKILNQYKEQKHELVSILQNYTSLTKDEAKSILLRLLEEDLCQQKSNLIRRYEMEAIEEAKNRANFIIAQATTRFAGEFASQKFVNVINIPDNEMKGRIIGRDGRNIRVFEIVSGVDMIIEDGSNSILLSSFNLYRRAIATKTLERLIEDGRIYPTRIEEVYEKVKNQMEDQLIQDAETIIQDLDIGSVHIELKKLIGKLNYRAGFGQNALAHSIEVAKIAGVIASELGGDEKLARRAGLFHDIGKALTDKHGGNHVDLGAEVCLRYNEHSVIINAIRAHHGHEEAKSIECSAVCTADILSAARPGSRLGVLENYINRINDLEKIAMQKFGVKQAYAVNAGREIRVIVHTELIDDDKSVVLAKEIVDDIKKHIQYPGGIKVNVIREVRAVELV